MAALRKTTSVHPKTVQKVADNVVLISRKKRAPAKRSRNSKVVVTHWYDGIDPLIVAWVRANKIHYTRVEVVSPTEVIIRAKKEN